jgi:hypothetical protein
MSVDEIREKFATVSRQAVSQFRERYISDAETLLKIDAAKALLKSDKRNAKWANKWSKNSYEGRLWNGIMSRCNTELQPNAYIGVSASDSFKDFQFFASWCQSQKGFKDTDFRGEVFQIDKDILVKGNKVYGEEFCVFVPREVNSFFIAGNFRDTGDLPNGVTLNKKSGTYIAQFRGFEDQPYQGSFKTAEEAFLVYKNLKEAKARLLAEKWGGRIDDRVTDILSNFTVDPILQP